VSLTRRILEGAQSQWSKLSSLVIVDDDPLSEVDSAVLLAELTARKAARTAAVPPISAAATMAGATPADQLARRRAASQRAERIGKERAAKEAKDKSSADEAFRRMKQQAAASSASTGGSAQSAGSATSSNARTAPKPSRSQPELAEWYSVLGVAPGDDMAKIKSSYRQLMRKYHPDMHAGNPQKQKAANELSIKVTIAYNGLSTYLEKR
jgi:DnaJ-domain-containing protein 1